MQYMTAMSCITTHKKIREIGGDLGKNNISHYVPILPPTPSKFGPFLHMKFMFLQRQDLGLLQIERNLQVCLKVM